MLADILRFNRAAIALANDGSDTRTLQEFLTMLDLGHEFKRYYLYPMTAAIWSARPDDVENFPAFFLARFFHNHGLLQLRNRPVWKTVQGGAHRYVQQLLAPLRRRVYANCPVQKVRRSPPPRDDRPASRGSAGFRSRRSRNPSRSGPAIARSTDGRGKIGSGLRFVTRKTRRRCTPTVICCLSAAAPGPVGTITCREHGNGRATLTYNLNRLQGLSAPETVCVTLNDSRPRGPPQDHSPVEIQTPGLQS